jgi:hypothetical protein
MRRGRAFVLLVGALVVGCRPTLVWYRKPWAAGNHEAMKALRRFGH